MRLILQTDAALDQDRMTVQFTIIALLLVAFLLGFLTFWYWKQTNPRRTAAQPLSSNDFFGAPAGNFEDGYQATPNSAAGARRGGPLVTQGPGSRAAKKQDREDSWATLTAAEPNRFEKP